MSESVEQLQAIAADLTAQKDAVREALRDVNTRLAAAERQRDREAAAAALRARRDAGEDVTALAAGLGLDLEE